MGAHADIMRAVKQPALVIVPTIAELYPEWTAYYKQNAAETTYADALTCFLQLLPHFGKIRPNLLTQTAIDNYKTIRLDSVSKRTITKELTYLSSMLNWAVERKYIEPLPIKIKGFPAKQTRARKPRPLSPEEINRVYHAIEPEYKLIFLLMSDAGLRRNEATRLQAHDVDMRSGLMLVTGKGDKERVVPVFTDRLYEELACKIEDARGYLSVNPKTGKPYYGIRKALARAATATKLPKHLHHHLLRHSFGTIATISGMHINAVQMAMGHADVSTTQQYQTLGAEFLKNEGRKFLSTHGQKE